ncbi:acetyl-CoA carboxylase carboxyltransferase subunit alpha [Amedibacillus sp. YH-ame10]
MSLKEKEARIVELEHALTQLSDEDVYQKEAIVKQIEEIKKEAYENLDAWDIVYLARHPKRPKASDYIEALFPDFIELHGDRAFGDDGACQGGLASFHGIAVTVLAQSKGKTLEENMKRNFGMLNPEGYRKALRLAKEAERFHRPIITLVDTSGAYPGKGAEERGQAEAIAQCLEVFSNLKTPVIAVVLSEGGSGGALAFSVADKIFMLENAVYSILSPEGFASILWKDGSRAAEAAAVMELTAADLKRKGIIDEIIHEPVGGAHVCLEYVIEQMDELLWTTLQDLNKKKDKTLLSERYEKFRKMGTSYEIL